MLSKSFGKLCNREEKKGKERLKGERVEKKEVKNYAFVARFWEAWALGRINLSSTAIYIMQVVKCGKLSSVTYRYFKCVVKINKKYLKNIYFISLKITYT